MQLCLKFRDAQHVLILDKFETSETNDVQHPS